MGRGQAWPVRTGLVADAGAVVEKGGNQVKMKKRALPSNVKPAKAKKAGGVSNAAAQVAKARTIQKSMDEVPGADPAR